MNNPTIFVYHKNEKIYVLSHYHATKLHDKLIREGWVHIQTLDPCKFLEHLYNECGEIERMKEIDLFGKEETK